LELHPRHDPDDLRPAPTADADAPADLGEFDPEVGRSEPLLSAVPAHAPGALSLSQEWGGVATPSPIDDEPIAAAPGLVLNLAEPSVARPTEGPRGWVASFAILAIVAGVVALGIVVWSTMSARTPPGASVDTPAGTAVALPEKPIAVPGPVEPRPQAPAQPAAEAPPPPPPIAEPPVERATPPRSAPAPASAAEPSSAGEMPASTRAAIDEALDSYRRSFTARDAVSVAGLEGADVAALQASFADRRYQSLTFDRCTVRLVDANAAVAACDGSVSEVLTSDPSLRRRFAAWTIALRRTAADHWAIERVAPR
jgi:hypothetical protein